jgi:2-dehydro-3-deoxyphosphogluconate aldolase / (4S)-4-hydroxy-2-oxoglutarate aldolase
MTTNQTDPVLHAILARRVIPVLTIDSPAHGARIAEALTAGGLPLAEVTLRNASAEAVLRRMAEHPGLLVGAGTVIRPEQVERVHDAGARFVVCPGFDPDIVQKCRELGLAVLPGVSTASDLQAATRAAINVVKLFPAEAAGGLRLLSALAAPFPHIRFVPTGGITEENMLTYLDHPAVAAVGGAWIAPRGLIAGENWDSITATARQAVNLAGGRS